MEKRIRVGFGILFIDGAVPGLHADAGGHRD